MSKADHRSIAETLLDEGFLLSALEFHTEILERGLPPVQLFKNFFDNPSNFAPEESPASLLSRSLSQATLDDSSLWGGISTEDSRQEVDNKLAVLEFELRKARELASKENASSMETNTPDQTALTLLNHLINDYLLENNYKLTSITFSDENADMDLRNGKNLCTTNPRIYSVSSETIISRTEDPPLFVDQESQTLQNGSSLSIETTHEVSIQTEEAEEEDNSEQEKVMSLFQTIEDKDNVIASLNERLSGFDDATVEMESKEEEGNLSDNNNSRQWDLQYLQDPFPLSHDIHGFICNKIGLSAQMTSSPFRSENEESLVSLLGLSLPKIVPNVLLAKREDLIPVILAVIHHHPQIKVRDGLLQILFNLIKKPDAAQRKMIIEGYVSLAEKFGPSRLESELLPHCWEQIDHKYPSRRTLVAETCITLMPYIPPSIRNSLVLSMLHQLALEDKDSNVRIAAVKGLSSLLLFLQEADKFSSIWKLTNTCLRDNDEQIIRSTQESLLLLAGVWCFTLGSEAERILGSEPIEDLLRHLTDIQEEATSFWKGIYFKVKTVHLLLPMVIASVFESDALEPKDSLRLKDGSADEPLIALSQEQVSHIQEFIANGFPNDSPKFAWFSSNIIEGVVKVSSVIPVKSSTERIVELLITIIKDIASYIGSSLLFPSGYASIISTVFLFPSSPLSPWSSSNIINDLKQWISFYARKSLNSSSIDYVVNKVIAGRPDLRNDFMDMNWEFLVSEDPLFRSKAGHYMNQIVLKAQVDYEFFNIKLLPGIVTLASDLEVSVKHSAIDALGSAAVHELTTANPELSEKVLLQFISLIEDQRDEESLEKFIYHLGFIIPLSSTKLRDQILLNKLGELTNRVIYERLYACINTTLESYRNILNNLELPKPLLRSHILPSLRNLSEILLDPSQKDSLSHILKSLESMALEPDVLSSPSSAYQMDKLPSSSPSMEEMKQRMGKIFTKSNWKK
ncbi:KIAA1468 -like protein [Caligus rogercresseyi]|uniref:KIAA1468 -like protein n=1 Tax=Caligus rogercresseyi TaxID=217165 RepID=A0A7T8HFE1_CALRO|nr:KIAA1468 -like protein [Caligus rogercresseyi]